MAHPPNDRIEPNQALVSLAEKMGLEVPDVVKLYEASVADLASKAKIDTYLHVFALRELQDKLSKHQSS